MKQILNMLRMEVTSQMLISFCRKIAFRFLAISEDRFGRLVTLKPFRTYAASALLACFCVGLFTQGAIGAASFIFVISCYPAVRVLFAIFRRLQWTWFC
jgi:hypothetical protein